MTLPEVNRPLAETLWGYYREVEARTNPPIVNDGGAEARSPYSLDSFFAHPIETLSPLLKDSWAIPVPHPRRRCSGKGRS